MVSGVDYRGDLQACGLTKRYGRQMAVDHIDVKIEGGTFFGLLGPNGAGKTTAISMLIGILTPDEGVVKFDGAAVCPSDPHFKRRIGFVPQEIALYDELSAQENLRLFGSLYGLSGQELQQRIDYALGVAGLQTKASTVVRTFSGGMKRRLNIAAALLHNPDLVILDEPTVGIDPQSRNAIFECLDELRASGKTLVYTTHYMEEVERLCDSIAVMDNAKIIAHGTLGELRKLVPGQRRITIDLEAAPETVSDVALEVSRLPGVRSATGQEQRLHVDVDSLEDALPLVLACILRRDIRYGSLESGRLSLEQVFLHLTGRSLRD